MSPEANGSGEGWPRGALPDEGVVEAYRIWLGRPPESQAAVEAKRGMDAAGLTAQLLASGEFGERIVRAIEERRLLAGQLFDAAPPASALSWAAGAAPLTPKSREGLLQARTWHGAYGVLFNDPLFAAWAAPLDARFGAGAFLGGLRDLNAGAGDRLIAGGLEQVSAGRIVGWALNRNSLDEPIAVELHIDGRFAAAAVTSRLRRSSVAIDLSRHPTFGSDFKALALRTTPFLDKFIFSHVPRTGGSVFLRVPEKLYDPGRVFIRFPQMSRTYITISPA